MILRKYRFTSKKAATTLINKLGDKHNHNIIILGEKPKEVDGEFVYSGTLDVDVIWDGEPHPDWKLKEVWTANPIHSVGGVALSTEYMKQCQVERPELFPKDDSDV